MKTTLQVVITHTTVGDNTPPKSSSIMADMIKRAIADKAGYWRENVRVESCEVLETKET